MRHWSNADGLSANAANSPEVRRALRNRARYESANNSYCRGMVLTLAHACISTGPSLQIRLENEDLNTEIEESFADWMELVHLPEKLRTMRQSRAVDGEVFGLLISNPRLDHEVSLDLRLIEADQVADANPFDFNQRPESSHVDGIDFDSSGNPTAYSILEAHPGAEGFNFSVQRARQVPAEFVLHYYRADRPGQARGIPEYTPALELFALLRRYTLATVAAAETAADLAAVLETTEPPLDDDEAPAGAITTTAPDGSTQWDALPISPRLMARLPEGYKMSQFKPEQPTSTYEPTVRQLINEIARCIEMPLAVALGNSSGYNFASGRLDFQVFGRAISIERRDIECAILRRIFYSWIAEARTAGRFRSVGLPAGRIPHKWLWPAERHVDPVKEATAQMMRLQNMTTTRAEECAADGLDWREVNAQLEREMIDMRDRGLIAASPQPGESPTKQKPQRPSDEPPPDEDEDENDQADEDEADEDEELDDDD
jgi:lambda family phage portal protein